MGEKEFNSFSLSSIILGKGIQLFVQGGEFLFPAADFCGVSCFNVWKQPYQTSGPGDEPGGSIFLLLSCALSLGVAPDTSCNQGGATVGEVGLGRL